MKTKLFLTVALVLLLIISLASCGKIANDKAGISDSESQPVADFNEKETIEEPPTDTSDSPTNPVTEPSTVADQSTSLMPDQSYLGIWYADIYQEDDIMIYEINSDSVKFSSGVFRHFGFDATAVKCDGEFFWGDDNSIFDGMKGRLRFDENGITVIYDSLGVFDDDYSYLEKEYHFTMKDSNSD